jgi:hypothetical protein
MVPHASSASSGLTPAPPGVARLVLGFILIGVGHVADDPPSGSSNAARDLAFFLFDFTVVRLAVEFLYMCAILHCFRVALVGRASNDPSFMLYGQLSGTRARCPLVELRPCRQRDRSPACSSVPNAPAPSRSVAARTLPSSA